MLYFLIYKWHKRFADGRDSLADDEREGRPSFRESDAVKNEVRDVINGDRLSHFETLTFQI
jgi:transposase